MTNNAKIHFTINFNALIIRFLFWAWGINLVLDTEIAGSGYF